MDSSVAGIGGCPYAKGASGNIATEDVVFLCELLGLDHGINIPRLLEVGDYISTQLQRTNLARVRNADLGIVADLRKDLI
jgi:hydroxymethylglutaryl-CoA lyase